MHQVELLGGRQIVLRGLSLFAGSLLACTFAFAQNSIQSLTGSVQSGAEVIRIETAEPLSAVPSGFTIQSPARIALDFPGVVNGIGRSALDIGQGNIRSANVVQAGDRTRVVINLKQPSTYQAKLDGKTLLLVLDGSSSASPTSVAQAAPAAAFAPSGNVDPAALKDIDFRRGVGNSGRVVVELANNQTGVDIRQQGKDLVVDFLKTTLPEGLRRKLDVTDFGTPVQSVVTSQVGDRVRMLVTPTGLWEHSAYQSDNQFVLEIREQKLDPSKLTQGPGYNGEKLSLNFQNIEVRSLLQVIADFTNFNVVTSDSVSGAVTLRLKDVPWDQALDIILQAKGLGMRKTGNVLWIAPKDEIAAREKQELQTQAENEVLAPLVTQAFQLNYARAEDLAEQLGQSVYSGDQNRSTQVSTSSRLLSPRGSVLVEKRTNQLFITDVASALVRVQEMIAKLDVPIRQVLIEARIVEADDRFGRSLGVRLGGSDLRGVRGGEAGYPVSGPNRVAIGGSYNAVSSTTVESENTLDTVNTSFVNLPSAGAGGFLPAAFAVSLFSSAANRFLNLEISALEADGRGKIVSSPRVVTADNKEALIEQGTEFPYQTATSSGATAVSFRKANLQLKVKPQITPEGGIILDVDINKDSRGETTAAGIAINTKHVQTQVLVENGGTVVIGGIFTEEETEDVAKVPLFGDLPIVGNLFKNKNKSSRKQELLIFLTPRSITEGAMARR
ncbi:type IV pilus secretin PilQ [Hydrogenophaga pseudoflava]|uniref:type IV pilus secretin PilQ n=1 Tax=Hydrogenophaga pseudoflava TaxID=47421 RepID=UPI0010572513|nr:type IV pilus secretin PilQ [Hydrogenophaga pseudoflava]